MENMKISLITGFLGAGKTTFIKKYASYLKKQGEKVLVIENEYGLAGVDGAFLEEESIAVKELAGGCLCCTMKSGFYYYLMKAVEDGYDRVIIEPSGIYNLDTFFEIMEDESLQEHCTCESIITIVKPDFKKYLDEKSADVICSQFLSTGAIVFSNTQAYTKEEIELAYEQIVKFLDDYGISEPLKQIPVYKQNWDTFTDEDFKAIGKVGYQKEEHPLITGDHSMLYRSMRLNMVKKNQLEIEKFLDFCFTKEAGKILRVKGFIGCEDGKAYRINATDNCREIDCCESESPLLNILGSELQRQAIKSFSDIA